MVGPRFGIVSSIFLLVCLISVGAEPMGFNAAPLDKFWKGWERSKDIDTEEYEKQSSGTPPVSFLGGRKTTDASLAGAGLIMVGLGAVALTIALLMNLRGEKPLRKCLASERCHRMRQQIRKN